MKCLIQKHIYHMAWGYRSLPCIPDQSSYLKISSLFIKLTTKKTLKCLPYILISHFLWLLQWFIILDMNNLVKVSHHYWMLLQLSNQAEINMSSKMGHSLFKLGRYNRVFLEICAQIPIWTPMLKQWAVGSFFIKTSKWEKWWSWMT